MEHPVVFVDAVEEFLRLLKEFYGMSDKEMRIKLLVPTKDIPTFMMTKIGAYEQKLVEMQNLVDSKTWCRSRFENVAPYRNIPGMHFVIAKFEKI